MSEHDDWQELLSSGPALDALNLRLDKAARLVVPEATALHDLEDFRRGVSDANPAIVASVENAPHWSPWNNKL